MTNAVKEVCLVQQILSKRGTNLMPAVICEDNTVAIFLATNSQVGMQTKHIDVRYHFLRNKVEDGEVVFICVRSKNNPSDLLTKNVGQQIHDRHAENILNGTVNCWNRNPSPVESHSSTLFIFSVPLSRQSCPPLLLRSPTHAFSIFSQKLE